MPDKPENWPDLVWTFQDDEKAQPVFQPSAGATVSYARTLRNLARQVNKILLAHSPQKAEEVLLKYANEIRGWAEAAARNMLYGLNKNNLAMFQRQARRMGLDMRMFLDGTKTGEVISRHIENNTNLIVAIPREAARKAGEWAHESLITGARPEETAKRIREICKTTESGAKRIARTETGKAYTALTKARAESVGSEGYIWRTGRDGAVRPSHRAMEGKFIKWSEPPTLDGMTGHAGEFPNCRCHTEPVIPRTDGSLRPFFTGLATQEEEKAGGVKLFRSQWEKTVASSEKNTVPVIPHQKGEPLFNVEKASFNQQKLAGYSMDFNHPEGKAKARGWQDILGFTVKDAKAIEAHVMRELPKYPASLLHKSLEYGEKFNVMIPITGKNGRTVEIKTSWIYDRLNDKTGFSTMPRLTTIFIPHK